MVRNKQQTQEQNEQYVRDTFSHFLSGNVTYVIRDEAGQILALGMDEPVIKNAQTRIIEKTNKFYEYEKMVMKLEKVE
jgi:hypothetical protein